MPGLERIGGPYRGSTIPVFGGVRTKGSGGSNIYPDQKRKNFEADARFPPNTHLCSPAPSSFSLPFDLYCVCDLSFSSCASSSKMYWFMKAVTRPFLAVS